MTGHNDDTSPDVSSCRYRKRISPLYDPHTWIHERCSVLLQQDKLDGCDKNVSGDIW